MTLERQIELAARSTIDALEADIAAKQADLKRLVAELQCSCSHDEIVETPQQASGIIASAKPPARVCTTCGLAECGWATHALLSLGDQEYRKRLRQVTLDEFYKLRRGVTHRSDGFDRRDPAAMREQLRAVLLGVQ